MEKKSPDEIIVLGMCIMSMLGLVPFFFLRLSIGDWFVAAIDGIGAISAFLCFRHVERSRSVRFVGPFLAILALAGMTLNIYLLGEGDLYFLYPVVIAAFFLMQPVMALAMTTVVAVLVTAFTYPVLPLFDSVKLLLSLLGTALFAFTFGWQRNRQRDHLRKLSRVDSLTGAGNRRALHEHMAELIAVHERDKQPMSLIILDLDDFKLINDQHGHLAGDKVLTQLTQLAMSRIRSTDRLFRYGGDEFLILANFSDAQTTHVLAEDIRKLIHDDKVVAGQHVSVSLGISQYRTGETADEWLLRADQAMYSVKQSGKNAVAEDAVASVLLS